MADRLFLALVWVNCLARVGAGGSEVSPILAVSWGSGNARSAINPVTAATALRGARGNARSAITPVDATTWLLAWGHLVPLGHAVATPVGAGCCPHDCCAQRLAVFLKCFLDLAAWHLQ